MGKRRRKTKQKLWFEVRRVEGKVATLIGHVTADDHETAVELAVIEHAIPEGQRRGLFARLVREA